MSCNLSAYIVVGCKLVDAVIRGKEDEEWDDLYDKGEYLYDNYRLEKFIEFDTFEEEERIIGFKVASAEWGNEIIHIDEIKTKCENFEGKLKEILSPNCEIHTYLIPEYF